MTWRCTGKVSGPRHSISEIHPPIPYAEASRDYVCKTSAATSSHVQNLHITETTIYVGNIFGNNIHVYWLCVRNIYNLWLSNKVFCNIHIGDTLNYLNSRCNTAKLLWVVIYVVCYGCFSPDLVVMNICRQRLIKVDHLLRQRSLANENAVVCRQGAMRWRVSTLPIAPSFLSTLPASPAIPLQMWRTDRQMDRHFCFLYI